jgi:tetratricopeptide (TPR) repeat protein
LAEIQPENTIYSYWAALTQLRGGLDDSYHDTCRGMVERFQDTEKASDAHWTAWTCLLAPDAVQDYGPVVRLAEQAVEAEPNSGVYLKTLGGIFYRVGRFEEAVQRLAEADKLIDDLDSQSKSSPAYTWYFLAMAHHKLGHDDEAKKWLDKATEWTDKILAEEEEGTATVAWNRLLTLKLLREEAEAMIAEDE